VSAKPAPAGITTARGRAALLCIIAVLFQAVLFGWHHHPLPPTARGSQPAIVANAGAPISPANAEDGCDICVALHHFSASPVDFMFLPRPIVAASASRLPHAVLTARTAEPGFHARAPPPASDPRV
jgi:hypothetical protein